MPPAVIFLATLLASPAAQATAEQDCGTGYITSLRYTYAGEDVQLFAQLRIKTNDAAPVNIRVDLPSKGEHDWSRFLRLESTFRSAMTSRSLVKITTRGSKGVSVCTAAAQDYSINVEPAA